METEPLLTPREQFPKPDHSKEGQTRDVVLHRLGMLLFVGCLTSQQHASVSQ